MIHNYIVACCMMIKKGCEETGNIISRLFHEICMVWMMEGVGVISTLVEGLHKGNFEY